MSSLLMRAALSHLDYDDREDAQSMLLLLGLHRYGQLSESHNVRMPKLKQLYAKAMLDFGATYDTSSSSVFNEDYPELEAAAAAAKRERVDEHLLGIYPYRGEEESKGHGHAMPLILPPSPSRSPKAAAVSPTVKVTAARARPPVASSSSSSPTCLRKSRQDVLASFPFVDEKTSMNELLTQPLAAPDFLSMGVPMRKRRAETVFHELSVGRAGMLVSDIPAGLALLGLQLGEELLEAFKGRSKDAPLSLGQWQTVVKRFVEKEVEKRQALGFKQKVTTARHLHNAHHQNHNHHNQQQQQQQPSSYYPQYQYNNTYPQPRARSARSEYYSSSSRGGKQTDEEEFDIFGIPIRRTRDDVGAVDIANKFILGPIGRELSHFTQRGGWQDVYLAAAASASARQQQHEFEEEEEKEERPSYPLPMLPRRHKEDEEEELRQKEAQVLDSLGLRLADPNGGPRETYDKPSMSLAQAAEKNRGGGGGGGGGAGSGEGGTAAAPKGGERVEGWKRVRGGWIGEFGPPHSADQLEKNVIVQPVLSEDTLAQLKSRMRGTSALLASNSAVSASAPATAFSSAAAAATASAFTSSSSSSTENVTKAAKTSTSSASSAAVAPPTKRIVPPALSVATMAAVREKEDAEDAANSSGSDFAVGSPSLASPIRRPTLSPPHENFLGGNALSNALGNTHNYFTEADSDDDTSSSKASSRKRTSFTGDSSMDGNMEFLGAGVQPN